MTVPYAPQSVDVHRPAAGAESGMVDPWDATEVATSESAGATVYAGVRACFTSPEVETTTGPPPRTVERWVVLLDPADVQQGDWLTCAAKGGRWTVDSVLQRDAGLVNDHTRVAVHQVHGEVS